jgi:hypothetical protein
MTATLYRLFMRRSLDDFSVQPEFLLAKRAFQGTNPGLRVDLSTRGRNADLNFMVGAKR